jgi:hypothetical protein
MNINSIITAATINKSFKVAVFGSTVVVTDDHHKTNRFEFGTRQEATDAAMELVDRCTMNFKAADYNWLKAEATRSQYMAAGLIA